MTSRISLDYSGVSDSLWSHGLWPARLLCPWGFSRQEYWSGLPCPPPRNLPNPRTEPTSLSFANCIGGRSLAPLCFCNCKVRGHNSNPDSIATQQDIVTIKWTHACKTSQRVVDKENAYSLTVSYYQTPCSVRGCLHYWFNTPRLKEAMHLNASSRL